MKKTIHLLLFIFLFANCTKTSFKESQIMSTNGDAVSLNVGVNNNVNAKLTSPTITTPQFILYTIFKGQHSCDKSVLKPVKLSQMSFVAKFDSSAIYQTVNPVNQYDINKLYGFSEGFNHQYNSARIGWAWNDGALRLYAYAYNKGVRNSQEITTVTIGSEISCSISLSGYTYIFTVNGVSVSLPRATSTLTASGYQLYPYFGGDEVAPQNIFISIK
ncbi:MAG TPA: hypothetical protein VMY77_10660 [Chitinophagaceae bacterium]|nr:hypothetical protein [Chitinophagaceae bacterium]